MSKVSDKKQDKIKQMEVYITSSRCP